MITALYRVCCIFGMETTFMMSVCFTPLSRLRRNHRVLQVCQLTIRASSTNKVLVTLETVFSEENKKRCQENLTSIKAVRSAPWSKLKGLPQAAVLVPLCTVNGVPSLLFTLRSQSLNNYKGQVSFPGGKVDPDDSHKIQTAIRETEEEIGLDPDEVDVWGKMHAVPGKDLKMAVTPVLAYCGEVNADRLKISEHEVSEVFTCSLENLCHPDYYGYTKFRGKFNYTLPVFTGAKYRIWGLTAVILNQTLTILLPGIYKSDFILGSS